jgi:SpoVK/Ycf46/Vps4 family AAA+-type ATPase
MNTVSNSIPPVNVIIILKLTPITGIKQIFRRARREAPCLLVFEDVDSLITEMNRSFFLNEVDGLEDNDGLLMVSFSVSGRGSRLGLNRSPLIVLSSRRRITLRNSTRPFRTDRPGSIGNSTYPNV